MSRAPGPFDAPLAPFEGASPPAPRWFHDALARAPERTFVEVAGAQIESLAWGERGRPGLLLLHGAGAHADWWSFIAPFLAEEGRVAAFSLSGMGGSGHRDRYSTVGFAEEAFAVAQAAGLFSGPEKPVFAAHSFGGRVALRAAAGAGERLKGVVLLDTRLPVPGSPRPNPPVNERQDRTYPSLVQALARFRLLPSQPCENTFLLDHIARRGLRPVDPADPASAWRWRFDPYLFSHLEPSDVRADFAAARCPLAIVFGALSSHGQAAVLNEVRDIAPPGAPLVVLPEAHHHLMLDQPLALVACLRTLLATWPARV